MVPLTIRCVQLGDAERLAAIQVRAWQAAYRDVMPDAYLDDLDVDDRGAYWRRQVLALQPDQRLKVIVDDGVVVGFAAAGPEHDGRVAGIGELYAINLDPQVWGRGFGRALLRDVTAELAGLGHREAVLWVVPQNDRARRLYESEDWRDDPLTTTRRVSPSGRRQSRTRDGGLPDPRWPLDPARLAEQAAGELSTTPLRQERPTWATSKSW